MGFSSIGQFGRKILGLEKKETPVKSSKELADRLYEQASEKEKEEIRKQYRKPTNPEKINRTRERRKTTILVPEGAHLEALVRRELLMRAQETRGDLLSIGGKNFNFLKTGTWYVEKDKEKTQMIRSAKKLASNFLKEYSHEDRIEILHILQSLDQSKQLNEAPDKIKNFFKRAEYSLDIYNKKKKKNIPFNILKGQLFQRLKKAHQPHADLEKIIKKAKQIEEPLKEELEKIDPMELNPQELLNSDTNDDAEPLDLAEAIRLANKEGEKAKRRRNVA